MSVAFITAALLSECDLALTLVRAAQIDAKPADKPKWAERIDSLLDQRSRLTRMQKERAAANNPTTTL